MILVDANLLLCAYDRSSSLHEPARRWLEATFSGAGLVRLPWMVVLAFLRITTHPRALARPLDERAARTIIDTWFAQPNVDVIEPTERHWAILSRLVEQAQARGPLVMDAHLAALAIEHGATLFTHDRDFKRFDGLKVEFPLA